MRRALWAVLAAAIVAAPSSASAQGTTLASDLLKDWRAQKATMLKIAEAMPEDKFAFRATPAQRTWSEQILHVAGANIFLMRFLGGSNAAPAISESDRSTFGLNATSKADVLAALTRSYDYGESVLKDLNDAALIKAIQGPSYLGELTRAKLVYYTMGHALDIYGQMVVYLRLNGIVPPASQRGA
jgi:uncharacterized damage-inducible protein DinB